MKPNVLKSRDALLIVTYALEVELHRKNIPRIKDKFESYLECKSILPVIYFFPNERLMRAYSQIFYEEFKEKYHGRISFFYDSSANYEIDLKKIKGIRKGKEVMIHELFTNN